MKVIVLALLCGVALAQMDFHELVGHEVHALVAGNPSITMDECVAKCDDLFPMLDPHDEEATDRACQEACHMELTSGDHTHPPHPTNEPHPPPGNHHPPAGK